MSNRIVLIPFPEAVSFEHLVSTRGGNAVPQTENLFLQAKTQYESLVNALNQNGLSTDPAVLKGSQNLKVHEIGDTLELLKVNYDKTKVNLDNSIMRGWKKIDPQDVVCSDSMLLASTLAKLQAADDSLYVRGHCADGLDELESSDHTQTISVDDLVKILDGKLDKKFPGKVKIYACESSKDTVDSESFAKRFATALSKRGWINCTFYGYSEILKTFIEDISGHKTTERGTQSRASKDLIQVPTKHTDNKTCIID